MALSSSSAGVHMNGGEGITSYARNSTPQRRAQERLVPLVEAAVADLWPDDAADAARSIGVADLGCSSGPNTLFLVSVAVDAVRRRCYGASRPEVRVYLNDLPDNDFNTVFKKQLPEFLMRHRREQSKPEAASDAGADVFVFAAPGSFFGRLFPAGSVHLAISSFSLHWLSQVPPELTTGAVLNRGNICADRTSSASVIGAYERQFSADLSSFLSSRAAEIVPGGWLLVGLKGRSARDMSTDSSFAMNDHPTHILHAMVARGLVDAARLDAYNIPVYDPSAGEVRETVDAEGSFEVVSMESGHTAACDPAEFARAIRAVHEPMLTRHFGAGGIDMDEFVRTAEEHLDEVVREGRYKGMFVHVVSLRRQRREVG